LSTAYRVLKSDKDLFAVSFAQGRVHVVHITEDGLDSIIDYGGTIQKYTADSLKIADTHYIRNGFEFRVILPKKQ